MDWAKSTSKFEQGVKIKTKIRPWPKSSKPIRANVKKKSCTTIGYGKKLVQGQNSQTNNPPPPTFHGSSLF